MQIFSKRSSVKLAIVGVALIQVLLLLSGCATINMMKAPATKRVEISGTDFDTAFSKAMRTCTDLGYQINISNKDSGTFEAVQMKGAGLLGFGEISFTLDREGKSSFSAFISIRADNSQVTMDNFLQTYGKYVKIKV